MRARISWPTAGIAVYKRLNHTSGVLFTATSGGLLSGARIGHGERLYGPICLGMALLLVGSAGWLFERDALTLQKWPTAEAEIIRSYVVTRNSPHDGHDLYAARYELRYVLDSKEFVAIIDYGEPVADYNSAQARADHFLAGSRHLVHYNPQNPAEVRIEMSSYFAHFVGPLVLGSVGSMFLLFGVALSWGARRGRYPAVAPRAKVLS